MGQQINSRKPSGDDFKPRANLLSGHEDEVLKILVFSYTEIGCRVQYRSPGFGVSSTDANMSRVSAANSVVQVALYA